MQEIYLTKATPKELIFVREVLDVIKSNKVMLDMTSFFCDIKQQPAEQISVCNTPCCLVSTHVIYYNKCKIDCTYIEYLRHVGISYRSYLISFLLSTLWPKHDTEHAIRRLEFVSSNELIPCVKPTGRNPISLEAVDLETGYWWPMPSVYNEFNILSLTENAVSKSGDALTSNYLTINI